METMNRPNGLHLSVYRPADLGDCTRGGVSSRCDTLTLIGMIPEGEKIVRPRRVLQVSPATEQAPAVAIRVKHHRWPSASTSAAIVPVTWDDEAQAYAGPGEWVMAGGNYADTPDARWRDIVRDASGCQWAGPLGIHDRIEKSA